MIKDATKKGYRIAKDGDGIDISTRMETHRGTVQDGLSLTIKTEIDVGVCVDDDVINPLKDKTDKSWFFEQNVYDSNGCTRALKSTEGSGNIPKVIENEKEQTEK